MKHKIKGSSKVYKVFPQMGQLADMAIGDQKWYPRSACPSRVILEQEIKKRFDQDNKTFDVMVGKGILIRRLT